MSYYVNGAAWNWTGPYSAEWGRREAANVRLVRNMESVGWWLRRTLFTLFPIMSYKWHADQIYELYEDTVISSLRIALMQFQSAISPKVTWDMLSPLSTRSLIWQQGALTRVETKTRHGPNWTCCWYWRGVFGCGNCSYIVLLFEF